MWTAIRYTAPDGTVVTWKLDERGRLIPMTPTPVSAFDYRHETIRGSDREYSMSPPFTDMPPFIPKK
jgi:hypothetical protein